MRRHVTQLAAAAAAAVACAVAVPAHAQVTHFVNLNDPVSIPGLAGFVTSGADMTGLSVRAVFDGGLDQTLSWFTTGSDAGGVFGDGWSLTLGGDSFTTNWVFDFMSADLGQLAQLVLDGSNGLTVFDRTEPSPGTAGSSSGLDFDFAAGCDGCVANAIYGFQTAIGAAPAVTDLYQSLTIDFVNLTGPRDDWQFVQDTDNDIRSVPGIPEPETYALMLGGLGLMGWLGRRRRKAGSK